MITAAAARKEVEKKNTESENQEMLIAEKKINEAIANKNTFCFLDFRISNSTTQALETLGYDVTRQHAIPQRGLEEYTRIAW